MTAFAISAPPGSCYFDLCSVRGHDLYVEPMEKEIELAACHYAATSFQNNGSLKSIRC